MSFNTQVRCDIVSMICASKSGHPGGSLGIVEILSVLYNKIMKNDPTNPKDPSRDFFILSKGHAAPALYSVLARKGYFDAEALPTLRKFGSKLQGHPDKNKVPGVEASTGSLGQGVSIAVGAALAFKSSGKPNKVYALSGDGELQEGQFWEAAMAAAHYKLDNYTLIIDNNGLQIDGDTAKVMNPGDLAAKMSAFGFEVIPVDGHDEAALEAAFKKSCSGKPKCLLAKTTKGKGISFMENSAGWHGKAPSTEQRDQALAELGGK